LVYPAFHFPRLRRHSIGKKLLHYFILGLAASCLFTPQLTRSQQVASAPKRSPESEIAFIGGNSVGNVHYFAFADNRRISAFGVEYDRHSFGRLLGSQFDYVAELLPVVLLNEPAQYDVNSLALTKARQIKYGANFAPVGLRMMWRENRSLKLYAVGKGGFMYFKDRVLSSESTKLNFSVQFGVGVEKTLSPRLGLRLGYSDLHFSNGNIARKNPGIDLMYFNAGLAYHFKR
jgi:opacity protein-like surface antigen